MKKTFLAVIIVSILVSVLTSSLFTSGVVSDYFPKDETKEETVSKGESEVKNLKKEKIEEIVEAYILFNPEIILKALTKLQEKEEQTAKEKRKETISKNRMILDDKRYPVIGKGKYPVYHFYDYNCGYCKIFSEVILEMAEKNKDIRIIMHDTPIFGDDSSYVAKVGLFANSKGKYIDFYKKMMKLKGKANEETASAVIKEIGLNVAEMKKFVKSDKTAEELLTKTKDFAVMLGISSMPTTVIDDELFLGAAGYDKMKELVDKYIENASANKKDGKKK